MPAGVTSLGVQLYNAAGSYRGNDSGFDDRRAVRRIDREDAVHALERRDDAACDRNRRAGRVGAAPARDERHAMRAARRDERDDVLMRCRENDRVRHRLAPRIVVAVDEARRFVGGEAALIQNSERMNSVVVAPWKAKRSGNHIQNSWA